MNWMEPAMQLGLRSRWLSLLQQIWAWRLVFNQIWAWRSVFTAYMPDIFKLRNQVVCPPVVAPGEFFVCTADVPRGSSLDIRVEMVMGSDYMVFG